MQLTNTVQFPVLRVNERHIRRFDSPAEMRITHQRYLDAREFVQQTELLDAQGNRYAITEVRKIRNSVNPLRFRLRSKDRAILVEWQLGKPEPMTLDDAKKWLAGLVTKSDWYRQGGQTEREFRDYVGSAKSFPELIAKFSFYGKWVG